MQDTIIQRIGTTTRWSDITIHNNTVYLVEVPDQTLANDVGIQTKEVLANVEKNLAAHNSGKDRLLMVNIYLSDISFIETFNHIWDNWLIEGTAPVRACVQAVLAHPEYKVEVQVTAATK